MHEELFEELAGDIAVERKVTLPADPDRVWQHLTEGDLVADWMGGEVEIEVRPALGTQVTLGTMRGQVVRHFEDGVAVEFAVVQRAESLEAEFSASKQL